MRAFYPAYFALVATGFSQTWTGAISGNWNDPGNWDTGVPTGGMTTAIVFDQAIQPTTVHDISGGLTLNSLTFGAASGVRNTTGNPLVFDGINPRLRMINGTGTGNTVLGNPVVLNQTLSIEGGPGYSTQSLLNSASVISGVGGVRITGGITSFNAINTYSGATVIESGGLGVNRNTSFGASPSVTVQAGGWLQLVGGAVSINKPLTIAGTGTVVPASGYSLAASGGGSKEWIGAITLADDTTVATFGGTAFSLSGSPGIGLDGNTLTLLTGGAAADSIAVSKVIGGSGNLIIKPDTLSNGVSLTGANTFAGSILVSSGRLSINSSAALGASSNPVTVDGSILRATTGLTIPATHPITIGAGGATFRGGDGSQANQALVLQSDLGGANPITIQQRVTLGGANSFSGTVTVQPGGVLRTTSDSNLGATSSAILLDGSAAAPARVVLPLGFNPARVISIPGTHGVIETTAPVAFTQPLTGPGELKLNSHNGAVTFTTANTHEGGTFIESGRVTIHDDSALGVVGAPLTLSGQSVLAASRDLVIPASRPLKFSGGDIDTTGVKIHVMGDMEGINGGSAGIIGTGTFQLDGTLTGGAYITDSTFTGTCTLDDFVNVDGDAVIAPGTATSKGTITMANIRMNEGTFRVKVGGGSSDKLVVTEGLVFQISTELEIVVTGAVVAGDTFTVLEKDGTAPHNTSFYSPTGDSLGHSQSFTYDGVIWTINYNGGDGNEVTITALSGNAVPLALPGLANLVFTPPSSTDPESLDSYPKTSGTVVSGVPGSTVYLESSTDLGQTNEWSVIETFTLDAAGGAVFNDLYSFSDNAPSRNFFRLRVP